MPRCSERSSFLRWLSWTKRASVFMKARASSAVIGLARCAFAHASGSSAAWSGDGAKSVASKSGKYRDMIASEFTMSGSVEIRTHERRLGEKAELGFRADLLAVCRPLLRSRSAARAARQQDTQFRADRRSLAQG